MGSILGLGLIYPKSRVWFKVIVSLTLTFRVEKQFTSPIELDLEAGNLVYVVMSRHVTPIETGNSLPTPRHNTDKSSHTGCVYVLVNL